MILITGATGLVGSHLTWHLLQENNRVKAICRKSTSPEQLLKVFSFYTHQPERYISKIDWVTADVLDKTTLQKAMKGVSQVYHCAAIVSLASTAETLLQTNIQGTKNVVAAALEAKVAKFCFVSSVAACGESEKDEFITENLVWENNPERSDYSKSKYYSEQEVWEGIKQGLKAVIVNPGVILGASPNTEGSMKLFTQVEKGLPFYTMGGSAYVDVRDVVKIMIRLTKSDISSERYILVGENCSNRDILNWIADGLGKKRPIINIGKSALWLAGCIVEGLAKVFRFTPVISRSSVASMTNRKYFSNEKIKTLFNVEFIPIEKSIQDICHFLRQQH